MRTLHVHLDESGDLNFSSEGSRYYIFSAAWTYDPAPLANELAALRFELVKNGHGERLGGFHAREDPVLRRERVFAILTKHLTWKFASIVVDKRRVNPAIRDLDEFYPKFSSMVLRFVFKGRVKPGTRCVLIYTDTLPFTGKQARAAEAAIKATCRSDLPSGLPFHVLHHRRESNAWIQWPTTAVGAFAESGSTALRKNTTKSGRDWPQPKSTQCLAVTEPPTTESK